MFKFDIGDKFYIGVTQYMVVQRDFQTDSLTAKHLSLGCYVSISGQIMTTLATKEEGRPDVFLGVQFPLLEEPRHQGINSEAALKFLMDDGLYKPGLHPQWSPHFTRRVPLNTRPLNNTLKTACTHTRATYDSGWSKYDYCTKCDEKLD